MSQAWAFFLGGILLYIPAISYPMMTITLWGEETSSTIISGVLSLMDIGMWPLALLVFLASICIPILKLLTLFYLLLYVECRFSWNPKHCLQLYNVIKYIGRWSMIDVFMVSILLAVIQMENIATIRADIAISAFAAVVILTMLSTHSFDPRLLWDAHKKSPAHER